MQFAGGVTGEFRGFVLLEGLQRLFGGDVEDESLLVVERLELGNEGLLIEGIDAVVGKMAVLSADLHRGEEQGVVVDRIPGIVELDLYDRSVLLHGHGEERERSADGEILLAGEFSLDERICDIEVEGSLLPLVPVHLPDDLVDAFEDLLFFLGFHRIAQVHDPLVSENKVEDVVSVCGRRGIERCLLVGLGLEKQTVALADVDKFLLELPEGLGEASVYGGTFRGGQRVFPRHREEIVPVLFDKSVAYPFDGREIIQFGRNAL
jgi:hypothetical protein